MNKGRKCKVVPAQLIDENFDPSASISDLVESCKSDHQHMSNGEQIFKVKLRKFNRKKFSQKGFEFKKVEVISQNSLKQFETPNPFKLPENIDLDNLSKKKSNVNTKAVPKHLLKKCRYCNYKKRSCV